MCRNVKGKEYLCTHNIFIEKKSSRLLLESPNHTRQYQDQILCLIATDALLIS